MSELSSPFNPTITNLLLLMIIFGGSMVLVGAKFRAEWMIWGGVVLMIIFGLITGLYGVWREKNE